VTGDEVEGGAQSLGLAQVHDPIKVVERVTLSMAGLYQRSVHQLTSASDRRTTLDNIARDRSGYQVKREEGKGKRVVHVMAGNDTKIALLSLQSWPQPFQASPQHFDILIHDWPCQKPFLVGKRPRSGKPVVLVTPLDSDDGADRLRDGAKAEVIKPAAGAASAAGGGRGERGRHRGAGASAPGSSEGPASAASR